MEHGMIEFVAADDVQPQIPSDEFGGKTESVRLVPAACEQAHSKFAILFQFDQRRYASAKFTMHDVAAVALIAGQCLFHKFAYGVPDENMHFLNPRCRLRRNTQA